MTDCADFLAALWGPAWAPNKVLLWDKVPWPGTGGISHFISQPSDADAFAGKVDIYAGAGLMPRSFGPTHRGGAADVVGIPGVWLDIDIKGSPTANEGKVKQYGVENEEDAFALARVALEPTIIVNSGYGLQGWWLLAEPWIWGTDAEDHARATRIVYGWWLRHQHEAKVAGAKLDHTGDLARVMRLPGTFNGKGGVQVPAVWLDADDLGPRYTLTQLEALGIAQAPAAAVNGAGVHIKLNPKAEPDPKRLLAAIDADEDFEDAWKRRGRGPEDSTASGWCLRLANYAVRAGWTDQDIADLLIKYRRDHHDSEKNAKWYATTIAKARVGRQRQLAQAKETEDAEEALADLKEMSREDVVDPSRALAAFNQLVPGLQAKELVKQGSDPGSARYALVMATGTSVEVGNSKHLLDPDHIRACLVDAENVVMLPVKRNDWQIALRGLLKVVNYVEAEPETAVTLGWLMGYLEARIADDEHWDEAASARQPFERDGFVWVSLNDFLRYVRRGVGEAIKPADLQRRMTTVGFVADKVTCSQPGKKGVRTSRQYWRVPQERLT